VSALDTQAAIPELFEGNTVEFELAWAVIALHREDPRRSFRELGRVAGCSHPHAARIVRADQDDPVGIVDYLAGAGLRV
jgi:hypothetical protein